jgi:hypothetical protein
MQMNFLFENSPNKFADFAKKFAKSDISNYKDCVAKNVRRKKVQQTSKSL